MASRKVARKIVANNASLHEKAKWEAEKARTYKHELKVWLVTASRYRRRRKSINTDVIFKLM